jgi:hypothetical protein
VDEKQDFALADLEDLILQLGYSKNTAAMVIAFLKSQEGEVAAAAELRKDLLEIQDFLERRLKPRYLSRQLNRLMALLDIRVELRDSAFYLTKVLFEPRQTDARLRLAYARLKWLASDCYELAVLETDAYLTVHPQLSLKDALHALETDPRLIP